MILQEMIDYLNMANNTFYCINESYITIMYDYGSGKIPINVFSMNSLVDWVDIDNSVFII